MRPARPLLLAGALIAAPLLSGCVAAAIPALAAGGVFKSRIDRSDEETADPAQSSAQAARSRPVEPAAAGADQLAREPAPAAMAAGTSELPGDYTLEDGTRVRVLSGGLPAPSAGTATGSYDAFADFAQAQGQIPVAGSERRSAILAHPLDLRPETTECSIHPAAVLIDVDPVGGTVDPAAAIHGDPQFAAKLASLRADGVAIGWISANSADRAGELRRALVASGLDPEGRDELVLLRYPEERKQTRRADFAKEFCLVAIAGDDRSDFDELFQYIKNPFLAAPLDALLGNGWFLIPQPLT
jgi:hypothetical protein